MSSNPINCSVTMPTQRGSSAGCTKPPSNIVNSAIGELRSRVFMQGVEGSEELFELALEVVREKSLSQDDKKEFVKRMLASDNSREAGVRLAREWGIETSPVTGTSTEIIPPKAREIPRKELFGRKISEGVSEEVDNLIALVNTTLAAPGSRRSAINSIAVAMNDDTLSNSEKEQAFGILRTQRGDRMIGDLRTELDIIRVVDFASKRDVPEKESKLKAMVANLSGYAQRQVFGRMRTSGFDGLVDQLEGELATEAEDGRVAPSPTPTGRSGLFIDELDFPPSEPDEGERGVQSDDDRDSAVNFGRMIGQNSEVINNNNAVINDNSKVINNNNAMIGGMIEVMKLLMSRLSEGTMPSARDGDVDAANAWKKVDSLESLLKEKDAALEAANKRATNMKEEIIKTANERVAKAETEAANMKEEIKALQAKLPAPSDSE